jgi:transposase
VDRSVVLLDDIDPQLWPANVSSRIADHPVSRIDELVPWNWKHGGHVVTACAA